MTSYFRSIFTRRNVDFSRNEAHQRALTKMDEIIHRIEQHNSPYIASSALEDIQIQCHELELPCDNILFMPMFFQWPREPLPRSHPTDKETQRSLKAIERGCSEEIRGRRQMPSSPMTMAEGLGSNFEWMFRAWRRDVPPDGDGLVRSLMRMAQWRSVGFPPEVIADGFDLPIWQSLNWNPRDA